MECSVSYNGQTEDGPKTWSLNKRSRNALIDKFGNDTSKWVGKKIPIETAITEKGRAIYVDVVELGKIQETIG